jgi:hypothetical protein
MKNLTLLIFLTGFAYAQNRQSTVDVPEDVRSSALIRKADEVNATSSEVLIPALKGLAIAPTADEALSLQSKQAQGVNCAGMSQSEVAALHNLLAPYIGQSISLDSLQAMARKVEKAKPPYKRVCHFCGKKTLDEHETICLDCGAGTRIYEDK